MADGGGGLHPAPGAPGSSRWSPRTCRSASSPPSAWEPWCSADWDSSPHAEPEAADGTR
jgi:hypothetical protein